MAGQRSRWHALLCQHGRIYLFTLFQNSTASFQLLLVSVSFHGPLPDTLDATVSPNAHAVWRLGGTLSSRLDRQCPAKAPRGSPKAHFPGPRTSLPSQGSEGGEDFLALAGRRCCSPRINGRRGRKNAPVRSGHARRSASAARWAVLYKYNIKRILYYIYIIIYIMYIGLGEPRRRCGRSSPRRRWRAW